MQRDVVPVNPAQRSTILRFRIRELLDSNFEILGLKIAVRAHAGMTTTHHTKIALMVYWGSYA